MTGQTLAAIAEADAVLFVIDARAGVTAGDEIIAQALHRTRQEGDPGRQQMRRPHRARRARRRVRLGFGEPLKLSAEHALGMEELADALEALAPHAVFPTRKREAEDSRERGRRRRFRLSLAAARWRLVGRPNVGKSSLFNQLLGEERSITGPEAGLTRDAIAAPWKIEDREVLLHDTAGLRKKARVAGETLEEMSVASTLDAIRFADCVIVMIDATQPFEKQDLAIADLIAREGRAIVFAVNKWDLMENKQGAISELREKLDRLLPQVAGAELVAISASTGEGHRPAGPPPSWPRTTPGTPASPTAALNRFLEAALLRHAPPAISGRRVRIRYMTQLKSAAAHLRPVRQPARCPARGLSALSAQRPARGVRSQGHAAAPCDAQHQKSLRSEE